MYGKAKIPFNLMVIICFGLVLIFMWSPDFLLALPVLLYVPFVYRLFYIKGNANILFWGLLYQWLAVSIQLIYCVILGVPLDDFFKNTIFPANLMVYTNYLSIIGIYFFTFGIFLAVKKLKVSIPEAIWDKYDPRKMIQVYVVVSIIINSSQAAIWAFPNLVQYFFFFFYIKWGFFLVTFIAVFKKAPDLKIFLFGIIGVEFVLGLSSFFASNFINIVIFSLIAYSSIRKKVTPAKAVLFVVLGVLVFHMCVLWTASKNDYRSFLKNGQMTQSVAVSKEEARKKLFELIVKIDARTYRLAIEDLVNRVGYVQYFAAAVRMVPSRIPYEDGKLYLAAIGHYLVPRFIDPDKETLDDSKHTNKYTGLGLSGRSKATSFSLGSFADAYIDFGPIFMFVPIFMFGYLVGIFFRVLYKNGLWAAIMTGPFFLLIPIYGIDTTKAIGFFLIYFLVIYILRRTLTKFLNPLLLHS